MNYPPNTILFAACHRYGAFLLWSDTWLLGNASLEDAKVEATDLHGPYDPWDSFSTLMIEVRSILRTEQPSEFWLILFSFSQLPGGKQFPWPWFYCILAWSKNCRGNELKNCQVSGEFQSLLASFVLPRIIGSNHWTLPEFDIADQSVSIIQMIWQG